MGDNVDTDVVEEQDALENEAQEEVTDSLLADPGELEGTRGDEGKEKKEHEPSPDHPRFKEVYRDLQETKRQLKRIHDDGFSASPAFKELVSQNKALVDEISKVVKVKGDNDDKDSEVIALEALQDELTDLGNKRDEARDAMEHKAADELSDRIADKKIAIVRAQAYVSKRNAERKANKESESAPATDTELKPVEVAFKAVASWYKDPGKEEMSIYAINTEAALALSPKWKGKTQDERFKETARLTEDAFGITKHKKSREASESSVEDGLGFNNIDIEAGTKLNKAEVQLAEGMGITKADWAAQKKMIGRI